MKNIRSKKKWVEGFNQATAEIEELQIGLEFFAEGEISEEEVTEQYDNALNTIEDLEFKNMLSDEGDSMSAVLQITAGAGGTESCDWAAMLMRMYLMWSEKNGYKIRCYCFP